MRMGNGLGVGRRVWPTKVTPKEIRRATLCVLGVHHRKLFLQCLRVEVTRELRKSSEPDARSLAHLVYPSLGLVLICWGRVIGGVRIKHGDRKSQFAGLAGRVMACSKEYRPDQQVKPVPPLSCFQQLVLLAWNRIEASVQCQKMATASISAPWSAANVQRKMAG